MKHKHADLIHAWADGAEIEIKHPSNSSWWDAKPPAWDLNYEYRIKPTPKPDLYKYVDLVRADEREACAKLCESCHWEMMPKEVAWAIRARGNHGKD
jgi:hypothetical protein